VRVKAASDQALTQDQGTSLMDHRHHVRLLDSELTETNLVNAPVYGAGDERIGKISHVHGMGKGGDVIVDVGGFLGMGAKPVSLSISQLDFMRDEHHHVHAKTAWTKEDIKALPEHVH
jgi:hypothetical protein